jgi:phosphohistidine phosphatase
MKTLVIIRHAKSSWDNPLLSDFDRPLNDRGKEDAPEMAKRLQRTKITPGIWLSSNAKRAYSTAKRFADVFGVDHSEIQQLDELYHASDSRLLETVHSIPAKHDVAFLFGHNPGLTDFVNQVSNLRTDNIPTCGVVVLQLPSWKKAGHEPAELLLYDYPKNL